MHPREIDLIRCFAAIARAKGVDLSANSLSRKYSHFEGSLDLEKVSVIARENQLKAKVIDGVTNDLSRIAKLLPAIALLRDGSPVILESVREDSTTGLNATLVSPDGDVIGDDVRVVVSEREAQQALSGKILVLKKVVRLTDESIPFSLSWVAGQVLRERNLFRDIAIASIFITTFTIAPAFITMIIVDRVIVNRSVSTLWAIAGIFAALIVFEMALSFLRRLLILTTATRIDGRINIYIMDRLLKIPMGYFENNPTGLTMGRLGQIGKVRSFLTGQLFSTVLDFITLIILVPILLLLNWKLSIFVFACAGIIFLIVYAYLGPIGRRLGPYIRAEREKGVYMTETLYGMRAIKSLVLEDRRRSGWDLRVAASIDTGYKYGAIANYPQTWTIPFERAMYSGSIVIGAAIIISGRVDSPPGALLAFGMLAGRVASPLVQAAKLITDFGEVRTAVDEVGQVLNTKAEEMRGETGLRLPVYGHISFKGVNYRYAPTAPLALRDVTFDITPGAIFGIMGRSGSGKTTITRLLQGLSQEYEGLIKIDGMDLKEMDIHHLRLNIGVVPQENFLFSGTIRDNISVAMPNASMAQVVRAAQLAGAEEFIERMPRGYETYLQEGASNLSGGQRQRLALARALIIDPPVLILDEATSALDAESEAIINANLAQIANDRTIICVSHRLSMLVPASAILVMERGEVYDIGRHEELLHRCDIYKHMWYTQNRHLDTGALDAPVYLTPASH